MAYRSNFGGNYESSYSPNNLGMSNASRNFNKASFRCISILKQIIPNSMAASGKFNLCWKTRGISSGRPKISLRLIWTMRGSGGLSSRTN